LTTPKYQYIADDLRERLAARTLPLEAEGPAGPFKLPGEKELAGEYNASRSTIRLALQVLVNQGMLETRHGLGTFVLDRIPPRNVPLDQEEDWQGGEHAEAAFKPAGELADGQTTARFQAETVLAPPDVASLLGIGEADQVILRRSRQHVDGKPWCLVVSYYPMDIALGTELETARRLSASSSQVLARLDHEVVRYTDSISARMPDPIETGFFRSAAIVPVLIVSRTAYDRQQPVRLTRYIFRADQVHLVDQRPAGPLRQAP
jgi:GntR family transcriptional regulator